ncbi:Diphthamide biosynthesis protein 2 [Geranomyces variabilis]|uniref:2-(3-amino-3-carboxypropyl)histidine synthase subunit 2 n=1 Tax=Geranomyces variabilis TaxID=109894 RepID=A0AAD5XM70_9FUNG|nr:Diphthamide biosynthesis protein 2 [Geranomyces variabilis]
MTAPLNGPTTFADDGSSVLQRTIAVPEADKALHPCSSLEDLLKSYDIDRTVQHILSNQCSKIALQFPDDLLVDAAEVSTIIKSRTGKDVYILADTTFGSCCVDEIAAEHALVDLVIHYGRACLSPTSRLPVLYVFPKAEIDLAHASDVFQSVFTGPRDQPILLLADVMYQHCVSDFAAAVRACGYTNVVESSIVHDFYDPRAAKGKPSRCCGGPPVACCGGQSMASPCASSVCGTEKSDTGCGGQSANDDLRSALATDMPEAIPQLKQHINRGGREYQLEENTTIGDYALVYIGPESLSLTNLVLTHNQCEIFSYDPVTRQSRNEKTGAGRLLMRRYFMVQKAKDAEVLGIVVGTLGAANYLSVISHVQRLIQAAGKKSYIIAVGKPNVAKLANFLEIDCFVLVACSENSLLDSREFLKPLVTPFELEMALVDGRDWTGEYITDLSLLDPRLEAGVQETVAAKADRAQKVAAHDGDASDEEPYYSLVTGTYKQASSSILRAPVDSTLEIENGVNQLVLRDQNGALTATSMSSAGARFLNEKRTFRGLEPQIGQTDVVRAVEGRRGIARGYADGEGKHI